MIKLSNKGQSLVIFAMLLPVILLIGVLAVDVCYAKYTLKRVDNVNKDAIRYGLNHIENNPYDNIIDLINKNEEDLKNIDLKIEDNVIKLTIEKDTKGFFSKIIGKSIYEEKSSYTGYIKDGKVIIEKGV